jgi:peptidyl-prolyl cis-trans isomerase SurA
LISNYSNTGFTKIEEISQHLKEYNINPKLIRNKMTINAIWSQFIYDKYSKNIKIDIDKLRQDIQTNEGQTEYLLSEIVFDLKEKQTINEKFSIIKNAIEENGFANTALIYSISETSTSGGNIGWVSENSINKKILKKIMEINISNFTEPLVIPGGYLILKVNEKRITKKDIKLEDELKKIIEIKTNKQLNQFSNIFLNKIKKDIIINEL